MRRYLAAGIALGALLAASAAWAGGVPNPVNAPASVGSGDLYGASGTNPQQAADTGISATTTPANKVVAGPTSGGSGALTARSLVSADIPSLSGSYCSLSGCTLTGALSGTTATFSGAMALNGCTIGSLAFCATGNATIGQLSIGYTTAPLTSFDINGSETVSNTGNFYGLNAYYSGGWKFRTGTDYAYVIRHNGSNLQIEASTASGAAGAAATLNDVLDVAYNGVTIQQLLTADAGINLAAGTYQIAGSQIAASNLANGTTGSGAIVLATSPALVTPNLGTPSAVNLANATNVPGAQLTGTVPGLNSSGDININEAGTANLNWTNNNAGSAGLILAQLDARGNNSTPTLETFVRQQWLINTATAGSELGEWKLCLRNAASIATCQIDALPSGVTFSGTIGASNFSGTHSGTSSGTNTGDQTITLTGDVTGSGTGSFAATIGANKVTLADLAQAAANTLLANVTGSTANVAAVAIPGCTDTSGNHLNYTAGTGFSCGTSDSHVGTVTSITAGTGLSGGAITTSGTIALNAASAGTIGGVNSITSAAHNWVAYIDTAGLPHQSQPAFTDVSGSVAATQLPNPSATTLGGVESAAAVSHQWIASISTAGVPALSQPSAADLSDGNTGTGAVAHATSPAIATPTVTGGTEDVEMLRAGDLYNSGSVTVTNSVTTSGAVTSPTLTSGHTYRFHASIIFTADATGGSRWLLKGVSGLTVTTLEANIKMTCNGTPGAVSVQAQVTALNSAVTQAGCTAGVIDIDGALTPSANGTLAFSFAQSVATTGTSTVVPALGATATVVRVN
jgi:hypothetical protein